MRHFPLQMICYLSKTYKNGEKFITRGCRDLKECPEESFPTKDNPVCSAADGGGSNISNMNCLACDYFENKNASRCLTHEPCKEKEVLQCLSCKDARSEEECKNNAKYETCGEKV